MVEVRQSDIDLFISLWEPDEALVDDIQAGRAFTGEIKEIARHRIEAEQRGRLAGMEEAAQWVLDRLEQERKDECSTIPNLTKPTTDTDYVAVPRDVLGAACYIIRKSEHAESKTAETLREYALAPQHTVL